MSEAFELHGKLLSTGSPYRAAMEVVNDPDRFADALTGVYATDPQYGTTLKWVMDNYRLKQYDDLRLEFAAGQRDLAAFAQPLLQHRNGRRGLALAAVVERLEGLDVDPLAGRILDIAAIELLSCAQ